MPSNHLILCHPLLLLPPNPPSIRVFSNESARRVRWAKYWSFSFSPSSECSALISFRMDWLDLLAVQGTLKNLLQHHSSLALSFLYSPLSHLYHGYRLLFKNCDNIHIQFMVLAIFKGTVQGREVHSSRAAIATVHPQDCLIFPHPVPTKPQSLPVPPTQPLVARQPLSFPTMNLICSGCQSLRSLSFCVWFILLCTASVRFPPCCIMCQSLLLFKD